jgi:hypothetical protein
MNTKLRKTSWKYFTGSLFLMTAISFPISSQAQRSGNIIRIGSPSEWSQYESYWNQLIDLKSANPTPKARSESASSNSTVTETDPQVLEQALIQNLRVSNLRLVPFFRHRRSSQIIGTITNLNNKAVTVSSVNLKVLDTFGNLIQTTTAIPEPSMIPSGASVTFQQRLDMVPADRSFEVHLFRDNPFILQTGS